MPLQPSATPGEEPRLSFSPYSLPTNEYLHDYQIGYAPPVPTLRPAFPPDHNCTKSLNSGYAASFDLVRSAYTPVAASKPLITHISPSVSFCPSIEDVLACNDPEKGWYDVDVVSTDITDDDEKSPTSDTTRWAPEAEDAAEINAAGPASQVRVVRPATRRPFTVIALAKLLFGPTIFLMVRSATMPLILATCSTGTFDTDPSVDLFFIAATLLVIGAALEAFSTTFNAVPDIEWQHLRHVNWDNMLRYLSACAAVVAIVLLLAGLGCMATEYSSIRLNLD